jgi:hypothetical protein
MSILKSKNVRNSWTFRIGAVLFLLIPGSTVIVFAATVLAYLFRKHEHAFRALLASMAALAGLTAWAGNGEWELTRQDPDLALYERQAPGSEVVAFKFDGVLDAPMDRVAGVILDYKSAPEWVDHLEEERILRQVNPTEFVEYMHVGTPFVVKDRDFVLRMRAQFDHAERAFTLVSESIEDDSAPESGYVRGKVIGSSFKLVAIDSEHTRLSGEIQADPMGSVPKWIVNLFQRKWPRATFDGIQARLKKDNLAVPAVFTPIVSELHEMVAQAPLPVRAIKTER